MNICNSRYFFLISTWKLVDQNLQNLHIFRTPFPRTPFPRTPFPRTPLDGCFCNCQFTSLNAHIIPNRFLWCLPAGETPTRSNPWKFLKNPNRFIWCLPAGKTPTRSDPWKIWKFFIFLSKSNSHHRGTETGCFYSEHLFMSLI